MSYIEFPATVEVSANEVFSGIVEISGTASYEDGVLTFRWQSKGIMGGWTEQPPIELLLSDIRAAWVKRSGGILIVQVQRLALIDLIPGDSNDALVLRVKRDARERARAMAEVIQRDLDHEAVLRGIPFRLPDTGFKEIRGLVTVEEGFLVFDVQTSIGGEFWKEQELIKIELAALEEVRFEPGKMNDHLHVRPRTRALLDAMPGNYKYDLRLRIKKRYRDDAWELMSALESQMAT